MMAAIERSFEDSIAISQRTRSKLFAQGYNIYTSYIFLNIKNSKKRLLPSSKRAEIYKIYPCVILVSSLGPRFTFVRVL